MRPIRIAEFRGAAAVPHRLVRFVADSDPVAARTFSDGGVDRYGDVIDPAGWVLTNYRANPVVLFGHDASTVGNVIGSAKNVRVSGGQLLGDIEFVPAGINAQADAVCAMVAAGILRSVSVGFQPLEWLASQDPARRGGVNFTSQELLEVSVCPIPANPAALIQSKSFGTAGARLNLCSPVQPDFTMKRASAAHAVDNGAEARRQRARATAVELGQPGVFRNLGDFLRTVRDHVAGHPDQRLVRAPTGAGEVDPSAGGFTVSTEYAADLVESLFEESAIAQLCDRRQTTKAETRVPAIDEQSRADGNRFGGTTNYWGRRGHD